MGLVTVIMQALGAGTPGGITVGSVGHTEGSGEAEGEADGDADGEADADGDGDGEGLQLQLQTPKSSVLQLA